MNSENTDVESKIKQIEKDFEREKSGDAFDESDDDYQEDVVIPVPQTAIKEKLDKMMKLKGDEKLKFISELLPVDERLDFFKVVKSLELDKNEETLAVLYVHVYLRFLYNDIPKAFDDMVQSMDSLTTDFDITVKESLSHFNSGMKSMIEKRKNALEEVDKNFLLEMEKHLVDFKVSANIEKEKILSEIVKSKDEHKRMVEEIRARTTKAFVNAIEERFSAYEPSSGFGVGKFFLVSTAVVFGMVAYDLLKTFLF